MALTDALYVAEIEPTEEVTERAVRVNTPIDVTRTKMNLHEVPREYERVLHTVEGGQ